MPETPCSRCMCKGANGTTTLREELEADNEGIRIPSTIRRPGRAADVKARSNEGTTRASSVVFESAFPGCRYDVDVCEVTRLDAPCGRCSRWGHIDAKCSATPMCA